ncbi:MAG: hypothetical protein JNG88_11885 [Phycisphaerales bacterium]|nr:hypothetical protein [Phycisphaerales bacterium]
MNKDWISLCNAPPPRDASEADEFVHRVATDWRTAGLAATVIPLCEYAEQVTLRPAECREKGITSLREAGWSDAAIHDATQIVAYFNYINRIADALGVEMEPNARIWGHR